MLLEKKTAVIYGAGGAVGGGVARAFLSREGTYVFLDGRTLKKVEAIAKEISLGQGTVGAAQVDTLGEPAVEKHLKDVVHKTRQEPDPTRDGGLSEWSETSVEAL